MSVQKIPNDLKQVIQSNEGDYNGNLWATFNIDLNSNPGTIKTAPRLTQALGADDIGTDVVQAITIYDGEYFVVTNDRVLSCSVNNDPTDSNNWTAVSTLGIEDLGLETDATSFNGNLLISLGNDIMSWDGSAKDDDWWTATTSGSALTANFPHTMKVLRTGNDTLFVTDKNLVRYYNAAAGHTTITLESLFVANTLTPSLDRMWVGTYTEVEENAFIYELRVGDDIAYNAYEVDGRACLSMFTYRNTPLVITEKGYIQAYNGAGFETVAQFPWANQSKVMEGCRPGLVQNTPTALAIHPKGAQVSGKYCYIFVNTDDEFESNDVMLNERGYAGIWVLDLETYSLSHRGAITNESTDYGVSQIALSGPVLITNTPYTRVMIGSEIGNNNGVWMEGTETPQGFFITTRHEAQSVDDAFETLVSKVDSLDTNETVTFKYKDVSKPDFPYYVDSITWYDGDRFTTTDALTDVEVGDEIFILKGHQAGKMAHITAIEGGTTKTVTVDESLGTLNELSDVQIEKWRKINTGHTSADGEVKKIGAGKVSPSRQYKVVMTGDVTLREFISKSNNKNEL